MKKAIEEGENGGEHCFIAVNSQDSCKERDEADEESGEERSGEQ